MNISISTFYEKIEEQKIIALNNPIHFFLSTDIKPELKSIFKGYEEIFKNPNLFSIQSSDQKNIENVLTSCINRTYSFYFYKSDKAFQEIWLNENLQKEFEKYPHIDFYSIDLTKSKISELEKIKEFQIFKYPFILIYRMGHLIDKIIPELEKDLPVSKQLQLISAEQKLKLVANSNLGENNILIDQEKIDFENRMREKMALQIKKEEEEKRLHLLEIKKKIEQDKKERKKKFGKQKKKYSFFFFFFFFLLNINNIKILKYLKIKKIKNKI